ncbi:hypothetical protein, partial [Burkholderia sp.]
RRTIDSLVEKGLLIKKKLANNKMDATLWYSVNLEKLVDQAEQIDVRKVSKSDAQDAHLSSAHSAHIPNTTENSSKTTPESSAATSSQLSLLEGTKKSKRPKRNEVTFAEYVATCKARGVRVSPSDGDPIEKWAKDVGVPFDFLPLAWEEFKDRYRSNSKRYVDWLAVFRNAVKNDWLHLWYFNANGECRLTTAGEQRRREMEATSK